MNNKANIGDTVVVTDPQMKGLLGVECIVVIRPGVSPIQCKNSSEYVWMTENKEDYNDVFWLYNDSYKITKRADVCEECKGTGKLDLFTSIVECHLCKAKR